VIVAFAYIVVFMTIAAQDGIWKAPKPVKVL
jgi:hypothetical protein